MDQEHEANISLANNNKDLAIQRMKQAFQVEGDDVKRLKVEYDKMGKDLDREHEARQKGLDRQADIAKQRTKD